MMNLIWPRNPSPSPSFLNRLGRLLHWALTAIAVATLIGAAIAAPGNSEAALLYLIGASLAFVAGRAARFLFSAE